MNTNTQKRIDEYLATAPGSHLNTQAFTSQEFSDILHTAMDVAHIDVTFRCGDKSYTKEDCRVKLNEDGIDESYNVYMGDLMECLESDPLQAKTLLKRMMLDRAIDDIYEMELWEK